jgi:CubicO group peptidase (beta-lactamase class C family)
MPRSHNRQEAAAGPAPAIPPLDAAQWQGRLAALAAEHSIPGATLGILQGDEVIDAAYGVLNMGTGAEVTTDTLFQVGSITKVWTATAVMRLVEQGKLDLDAPIVQVLPELKLSDPKVTQAVTMRHLLTHTSGIDGDVFTDTGRGDDCVERYVAGLAEVPQIHPMGATWSYCNSGFGLAGRVIEKLTGKVWDAAMRELLFTPLGLTRTVTLPEEALLHRAAVGHLAPAGQPVSPARVWQLDRSAGPAGLICSSARDVLAFVRMHLDGGVTASGERLLSNELVEQMQTEQVRLPVTHRADAGGLAWFRFGWDGHTLIGHDGNTLSQSAFLRVLPTQRLALVLLTNDGNAGDLFTDLCREVFAELAGIAAPEPLAPSAQPPPVDPARYVGTYERTRVRTEVFEHDGGLRMRITMTVSGPLITEPVRELDLHPVRDDLFATRTAGVRAWQPVTFYSIADGSPYLHFGGRANPKVA